MITLPTPLAKVMQSKDLSNLKPFAVLYRNKWYAEESASGYEESDSGSDLGGHFALDMANPIDISSMIVKPNTLSMTLDVTEIAQYNANNVTLTLSDPFNRFIEGTPLSFFPNGYQLYGSQVILYYGLDDTNRTPLFVGVIKDLPTHKPETYQVDLKLISPLELLNDIEAKEFSNKYVGEELHYEHQDDEQHRIYSTANTGVGGFNAVYADGVKIFEGVDYEVSQTNTLGVPALVTIINASYNNSTITADYYCWKTGLSIEQIVSGLVALGGYTSNTDIRSVVWSNLVRNQEGPTLIATLGYTSGPSNYISKDDFNGGNFNSGQVYLRHSYFPNNFQIDMNVTLVAGLSNVQPPTNYFLGEITSPFGNPINCLHIQFGNNSNNLYINVYKRLNGSSTYIGRATLRYGAGGGTKNLNLTIKKQGNTFTVIGDNSVTVDFDSFDLGNSNEWNERATGGTDNYIMQFNSFKLSLLDDNTSAITNKGILVESSINQLKTYTQIRGTLADDTFCNMFYRIKENGSFTAWQMANLNSNLGVETEKMQSIVNITSGNGNITDFSFEYLGSNLVLSFINLSGKTVLEALQDFALISGYEFGVDRQGVFFFRPRSQSTTPIYQLDHSEIVKVDTVKKNLNDFFTKLTLSFAQIPLEFYANEGERPTPIDRYGVINKDIDKPEIVNYDNPELAQAIGPQLLALYSSLADVIQCTAKLNLSLELGDIVNLKRNYNLTISPNASEYNKYITQDTYYRACKITGINYNFSKKQVTYTLRNVSNDNNKPQYTYDEFIYDFQVPLGVKE